MCKGEDNSAVVGRAATPLAHNKAECGASDSVFGCRVELRDAAEGGGREWCTLVQVPAGPSGKAVLPEVEVSENAIRLRSDVPKGDEGAWFVLPLPRHALPIDAEHARCSFAKRRAELTIAWPLREVEDNATQTVDQAEEHKEHKTDEEGQEEKDEVTDAAGEQEEIAADEEAMSSEDEAEREVVDAEEWRLRGNAAVKAAAFEEAVRCYSAGLARGGGDEAEAILRSNRAHCLIKLERYQEASEDATRCVELRPDFFKGYLRGATALGSLGKPEEALAFLKRCPPNNEAASMVAALKPVAEASQQARIGKLSGAERAKEEGNVLFKSGAFEDALVKYSEALDLCDDPEGALAMAARGNRAACAHQLSDYSAVVKDCSFVLQRDPTNLKALVRRMMALEPLERYQASLDDARAVLRMDPRHEVANRMQHRLGKLVRDLQRAEGVQ